MKVLVNNKDNIHEDEVTEVVKRVKVLLVNSKKEVLLGYSYHEYQFPGGHVEDGEDLITAVYREVEEETGIVLESNLNLEPFAVYHGYYKNWPSEGKNRKIEIYYYEVKTDVEPKLENVHYTEQEKNGNFTLKYIPLDRIEEELEENAKKFGDRKGISKEMVNLFGVYKR